MVPKDQTKKKGCWRSNPYLPLKYPRDVGDGAPRNAKSAPPWPPGDRAPGAPCLLIGSDMGGAYARVTPDASGERRLRQKKLTQIFEVEVKFHPRPNVNGCSRERRLRQKS